IVKTELWPEAGALAAAAGVPFSGSFSLSLSVVVPVEAPLSDSSLLADWAVLVLPVGSGVLPPDERSTVGVLLPGVRRRTGELVPANTPSGVTRRLRTSDCGA